MQREGPSGPSFFRNTGMKKILVLSHMPTRDDVVDVMLTQELGKHAVSWKVSVLDYIRGHCLSIKPDIVVFPEIRCEYTRDMVKQLHEWGVVVVQKRCEMGVTAESDIDAETHRAVFGNWQIGGYIDLDLVWGPRFGEMVARHTDISGDKIKVVGALGFDQYFIPPPPVEEPDGKTVLFAGGFGYADRQAIYSIPEAKLGEAIHTNSVADDRSRRHFFIELIKGFRKRFPDWTFKVRPHPGESGTAYNKALGEDVEFLANMPAVAALRNVDVVIHTGSTMAFEAHLLDKPTLNFRNTSLDTLVGSVAPTYACAEDLLDAFAVMDTTKSNADLEVIDRLKRDYYGPIDGKAHKRAAEAILALPARPTTYPREWPKDEIKYQSKGVHASVDKWFCAACLNLWFGDKGRDLLKCPYCGIPCVVHVPRKDENAILSLQKVSDGVNPPKDNV